MQDKFTCLVRVDGIGQVKIGNLKLNFYSNELRNVRTLKTFLKFSMRIILYLLLLIYVNFLFNSTLNYNSSLLHGQFLRNLDLVGF